MWPGRYFAPRYWNPRYWAKTGDTPAVGAGGVGYWLSRMRRRIGDE